MFFWIAFQTVDSTMRNQIQNSESQIIYRDADSVIERGAG
jgi:hypothetical protein